MKIWHRAPRQFVVALASSALVAANLATSAWASDSVAVPTSFTVTGNGAGHGAGLSQYGAQGMALAGHNYAQILTHYYSGTSIATGQSNVLLRIGIREDSMRLALRAEGLGATSQGMQINGVTVAAGQVIAIEPDSPNALVRGVAVPSDPTFDITWNSANTVVQVIKFDTSATTTSAILTAAENALGSLCATNYLTNGETSTTRASDHCYNRYRYGSLEIKAGKFPSSDSTFDLNLVNEVRLEDYLRGLAEVPSSWQSAALSAQAVAARTYAVSAYNGSTKSDCLCDLYDDTRNQAFVGFDKEYSISGNRWVASVVATAGRTIRDSSNNLIGAYYSSGTGGVTLAVENVWGNARSYAVAVDDHWAMDVMRATGSGNAPWTDTVSRSAVNSMLAAAGVTVTDVAAIAITDWYDNPNSEFAQYKGAVKTLEVSTTSGRVYQIKVGGTNSDDITNDELRNKLGLKSAFLLTITPSSSTTNVTPSEPRLALNSVTTATQLAPTVNYLSTVKIAATVSPTQQGATVKLQRNTANGWKTVSTATTNTASTAQLSFIPNAIGREQLRLVASTSAGSVATALSEFEAIGKVTLGSPASAKRKTQIRLNGSVRPYLKGVYVLIERKTATGWTKVARVRTTSKGYWSYYYQTPKTPGVVELRTKVTDPRIGRTTSRSDQITIS